MHLLTSGRTKAIITLPIVAFDFKFEKVNFASRLCETKRQSSFTSFFNPVPKKVSKCVRAWIRLLETKYNFSPLDPIFPKFTHPWEAVSTDGIRPTKERYKSGQALVCSFRAAFDAVGIEGITPHSLRTTMFREIEKLAATRMESKVYSMNLGQKDELVLLNSYSNVSEYEQEKTMRGLRKKARKKAWKKKN
jgi:integrase